MRRFLWRLTNLLGSRRAEREMAREMESHLALIQESLERHGLPPEEAARAARRHYGGVELSKELHREARSFVWVEQLVKDVRYAARNLRRSPGFTLPAVVALALGVGVNATLFALYNAATLKPIPVADPGRVLRLKRWFAHGSTRENPYNFAYPEYRYLRDHSSVFSGLTADNGGVAALGSIGRATAPVHLVGHLVSGNYFAELGVKAALGRTFLLKEDGAPGASPVVVISDRLWRRSFDANSQAVGRTILLNGVECTVIGVAPPSFTGTDGSPFESDFWAPLSMLAQLAPATARADWREQWRDATPPWFELLGRVKSGVPLAKAQAETDLLVRQFLSRYRETNRTTAVTLQRASLLTDDFVKGYREAGTVFWIMASLVLLVACANVANMLLARGSNRQKEIGIRLALGAGRGRVIRQLMTESLLLAFFGGTAGVLLSTWASRLLWLMVARSFQGFRVSVVDLDLSPDARVLAVGLALSLVTGILFGLAPAVRFARSSLNAAIKQGESAFGARAGRARLRNLLLGAQVAAAILLLSASTDLASLLKGPRAFDLGFDARDVFLVMRDEQAAQARANNQRLRARFEMLPELSNIAIGDVPFLGELISCPMATEQVNREALASYASDGYFEAMGIRLLRGRGFTRQEADHGAPLAVISESTARHFWPREDPLGKRFSLDLESDNHFAAFEVVGIARDIRSADLTEADASHIYLPVGSQRHLAGGLLFRTHGNRTKALAAVQSAVESVDRNLLPGLILVSLEEGPVAMVRDVSHGLGIALGSLIGLSLTLAAVGIYGVMAYLVTQRTREIGIRVALGATSRVVIRNLLAQGMRPVFLGMAAGVALGIVDTVWERSQAPFPDPMLHTLFGDPSLYVELVVMVAVAALACVIPAKRALRVDPAVTLRHE